MKRFMIAWAIATALFVETPIPAAAQGNDVEADDVTLFEWLRETPNDWETGLLFGALGLGGALFTTFTLVGGAFPGTAGKAKLDADSAIVDALTTRMKQLVDVATPNPEAIRAVGDQLDRLRDDLSRERWIQFAVAAILYAFLGALIAMALAKDLLQALVFGATWTGLVGTLGLKQDWLFRKETKEKGIEVLERELAGAKAMLQDERAKLTKAAVAESVPVDKVESLYGAAPELAMSPGDEQPILKAKAV